MLTDPEKPLDETPGYTNPVMPGFHPDPSVIRVGEDFYMVNSSFHLFPAIPISHSRDLIHWRYIGHGVSRQEWLDLSHYGDHWGVWAPDISYYEGIFYIVFPMVNRVEEELRFENYIIHSSRPEGPWSRPILLNRKGIDPSHFIDGDGKRYLVYNEGARILPLNEDSTAVIGEEKVLWEGTGRGWPEGPHILRKGGWYYIFLAEGGTFYGHCETVARSRTLDGPWEECPYGPIIEQRDPAHPIQRTGHGKMVEDGKGRWWFFYLCSRPLKDGRRSPLGRETAMDPVEWSTDGWPEVNGGRGPSVQQEGPDLPDVSDLVSGNAIEGNDDFTSPEPGLQWLTIRSFTEGGIRCLPGEGCVEITPWPEDLDSFNARNVLLQRERHLHYRFSCDCRYPLGYREDGADGQGGGGCSSAGITTFFDARAWIRWGISRPKRRENGEGAFVLTLVINHYGKKEMREFPLPASFTGLGRFSVQVEELRRIFSFTVFTSFSSDGTPEKPITTVVEDGSFLCDDIDEHSGFTGTLVGMYVLGDPETDPKARFSRVRYSPL